MWSYDEAMDRAYLAATLVSLSMDITMMLEAMSKGLSKGHPTIGEWIRQLGHRMANEVKTSDLEQPKRLTTRELAHRVGGLSEIVKTLVRVDYLPAEERAKLAQHLERIWHLAYELNGLKESGDLA